MYEIPVARVSSISIPTVAQYNQYNPPATPDTWKIPPIASGTDWWLLGNGAYSRYIYVVHNGKPNEYNGIVNYSGMKVRPFLNLNQSIIGQGTAPDIVAVGSIVRFGEIDWVVVTGTVVIPYDAIGTSPFRDDWKALNAQDYSASTLKKYVDNWLAYWKGTLVT